MHLLPRVLPFSTGTVITVHELTVADVRRLLDRGGNVGLGDVLEACPDRFEVDGEPTPAEWGSAWFEFEELNKALFAAGDRKKAGPLRTRKAGRDLDLSCLAAVEAGHVHVWDYPYRLFVLLTERAKG